MITTVLRNHKKEVIETISLSSPLPPVIKSGGRYFVIEETENSFGCGFDYVEIPSEIYELQPLVVKPRPHPIWEYLQGIKHKVKRKFVISGHTRWNNWGLGLKVYVLLFQRMATINIMFGPWEVMICYV